MWDITKKFTGKLPSGFSLKEEEDFIYLFYGGEQKAIFGIATTPLIIEKEAKRIFASIKHQTRTK